MLMEIILYKDYEVYVKLCQLPLLLVLFFIVIIIMTHCHSLVLLFIIHCNITQPMLCAYCLINTFASFFSFFFFFAFFLSF